MGFQLPRHHARSSRQSFQNRAEFRGLPPARRAGPSSGRSGRAIRLLIAVFLLPLSLVLIGCTWHQPREQAMPWHSSEAQAVVGMPAQTALAETQKAVSASPISLTIDSVKDGVIVTGWKEYPGDVHIVRRWYERTRFRITITRDFLHPDTDSRLSVEDQTMERATDAQPWYNAPNTSRPQRSAEVLKQIVSKISPQMDTDKHR